MSFSNKLKKYKIAYEKCLQKCQKSKKKSCKNSCEKFLKFDFHLQTKKHKSKSTKRKSKSKRKISSYQAFVKKEYKTVSHLDNKDRLKAIAKKWSIHKLKSKKN